jgi:plasmid stabilization system protein ParE
MPHQAKAVKLHPEARAELQESVAFYRKQAGKHWADRFKQAVAQGLSAIASNPERHPPVADMPGVQRIRLNQFPFSLLYVNRANDIWVVTVAHGSRKPDYWKGRVL